MSAIPVWYLYLVRHFIFNFYVSVRTQQNNFLILGLEYFLYVVAFQGVKYPQIIGTSKNAQNLLGKPETCILPTKKYFSFFSIPAAKKVEKVFANDLNPESYRWLVHNSTKNKAITRLRQIG